MIINWQSGYYRLRQCGVRSLGQVRVWFGIGGNLTTGTPDAKWKLPVTAFSWQVQEVQTKWELPVKIRIKSM